MNSHKIINRNKIQISSEETGQDQYIKRLIRKTDVSMKLENDHPTFWLLSPPLYCPVGSPKSQNERFAKGSTTSPPERGESVVTPAPEKDGTRRKVSAKGDNSGATHELVADVSCVVS